MRVAIIGCGFIGQKRARALAGGTLVGCFDVVADRSKALAEGTGTTQFSSWEEVIGRSDVDAVIVATTHEALPRIGLAAIKARNSFSLNRPGANGAALLRPFRARE